jgi:hypothetical protein
LKDGDAPENQGSPQSHSTVEFLKDGKVKTLWEAFVWYVLVHWAVCRLTPKALEVHVMLLRSELLGTYTAWALHSCKTHRGEQTVKAIWEGCIADVAEVVKEGASVADVQPRTALNAQAFFGGASNAAHLITASVAVTHVTPPELKDAMRSVCSSVQRKRMRTVVPQSAEDDADEMDDDQPLKKVCKTKVHKWVTSADMLHV